MRWDLLDEWRDHERPRCCHRASFIKTILNPLPVGAFKRSLFALKSRKTIINDKSFSGASLNCLDLSIKRHPAPKRSAVDVAAECPLNWLAKVAEMAIACR